MPFSVNPTFLMQGTRHICEFLYLQTRELIVSSEHKKDLIELRVSGPEKLESQLLRLQGFSPRRT